MNAYALMLIVVSLSMISSCRNRAADQSESSPQLASIGERKPGLCIATRGNGEAIMAHFPSLARIIEDYDEPVIGAAGGSSASISLFLLESIYANEQLRICSGSPCSGELYRRRVAYLVKSIHGYLDAVSASEEAAALKFLFDITGKVKELGIQELINAGQLDKAAGSLRTLLQSEFASLLNPEFMALLNPLPAQSFKFRLEEANTGIVEFGSFSTSDNRIFFRPGLLSFDEYAVFVSRIANFYAGRAADQEINQLLMEHVEMNAAKMAGRGWHDIRHTPEGKEFIKIVARYRLTARKATVANDRLKDPIGQHLRLLVVTSVLTGPAITKYQRARESYLNNSNPNVKNFNFKVDFDKVRYGYAGASDDVNALIDQISYAPWRKDLKSRKAISLFGMTWGEILRLSPAEPGLSRIVDFSFAGESFKSAGGWNDLHPTTALKAIGCERVIYLTREGPDSQFAMGAMKLLGAEKDGQLEKITNLNDPQSSFNTALGLSDAVICTNWNSKFPGEFLPEDDYFTKLAKDSYNAPFITKDPVLSNPKWNSYKREDEPFRNRFIIHSSTGEVGCAAKD